MVTDFKTLDKDSDLFDTLFTHFGKTINLARIKFLSRMIKAIVILRTVNFAKLSTAFGGKADSLSSMRRIQRFMSGYDLDLSGGKAHLQAFKRACSLISSHPVWQTLVNLHQRIGKKQSTLYGTNRFSVRNALILKIYQIFQISKESE